MKEKITPEMIKKSLNRRGHWLNKEKRAEIDQYILQKKTVDEITEEMFDENDVFEKDFVRNSIAGYLSRKLKSISANSKKESDEEESDEEDDGEF